MKETFYDRNSFKPYVENDFDRWRNGDLIPHNGSALVPIAPGNKEDEYFEEFKVTETVYSGNGDVLCEYYYYPELELYQKIHFTENADDKLPVTIVTSTIVTDERMDWSILLYGLLAANFATAAVIYFVKSRKYA